MNNILDFRLCGNDPRKSAMRSRGFTLIELLVAVVIIGLLATISIIALSSARAKARDARRVADVKQIQVGLEMFFADNQRYPTAEEFSRGSLISLSGHNTTTYMALIPTPPSPADGVCSSTSAYTYVPDFKGYSYTISYCLGGEAGGIAPGDHCATPANISDGTNCGIVGDEFSCPEVPVVQYEGGPYNYKGTTRVIPGPNTYYRTVKIGNQCWLRDNLNVGTMVNGAVNQTNNSVLEKYCHNNSAGNCDTYGGLYQWNEAMQYSTTAGAQGICPDGWHIPTDAEQNTLDQYLTDPGQTCNANRVSTWGCANAGTKLQVGGTSHFEDLLAGLRRVDGVTYGQGMNAFFWSSSIGDLDAWNRDLNAGYATVFRNHNDQNYGFSVRCLLDQ